MIGLFDRDVFLKLFCCDLWDEALVVLQVDEPYRLTSTSGVASNRRLVSRMMPDDLVAATLERITAAIETVPVISDNLSEKIYETAAYQCLSYIDDIDSGEQILTAIVLQDADHRTLISGDKRFIMAMRLQAPEQWELIEQSVVSFESCLLKIEAHYGLEYIRRKIGRAVVCDGTLRISLRENTHAVAFRESLLSFDPSLAAIAAE